MYRVVRSMLKERYEALVSLKEVQLLFLGDSKTGKTSTIRTFCKKRFLKDISSTLVLEDTNILKVDNKSFQPLTKYELSVQRVKNVLAMEYNKYHQINDSSTYLIPFETELLKRTLQDESFLDYFTDTNYTFKSITPFYRVSDFGGQEVFSSLHHVFMNQNAVYVLVFDLTKLTERDINRLRFWLNSVEKNAPKAPIIFIGTHLKLFLRKNRKKVLEKVSLKLFKVLSRNTKDFALNRTEHVHFFPIENSNPSDKTISKVHKKLKYLSKYREVVNNFYSSQLTLPCVWVLFLDNCREESNYISVKKFKNKGKVCNFTEENLDDMLEIYSKAGIIFYHKNLELSEELNFVFFAPSFIAQALGSFIRDSSLHQLAFRLNSEIFPEYRKYIDSGIIRKNLFDMLLKKYSEQERNYVLKLALSSMILLEFDEKTESYIIPELIPFVQNTRIIPSKESDDHIDFEKPLTLTTFTNVVLHLKKEHQPREVYLYRYFARFIFSPEKIIDIYQQTETKIGFKEMTYINRKINKKS
eukprot:snap_masked-scaffold_14-processed-gene-4.36-mRNA-1 protein AED:1.00 eAED:1.00 QI:0/0/0/0/1/1/2/0/526